MSLFLQKRSTNRVRIRSNSLAADLQRPDRFDNLPRGRCITIGQHVYFGDTGKAGWGMQIGSVWQETARCAATRSETLVGHAACDIAIVGGGFTGLSAALHAAELGRSVILVEAEDIAFGASGRNGGQVNPGLKHGEDALVARFGDAGRRFFRLGEEATDFLGRTIDRLGLDCAWRQPGVIRLAHSRQALAAARDACDALQARGVAALPLTAEDAARVTGCAGYLGGLIDPRGGSVHPLELARGLAAAAIAAGVRIFEHSPAVAVTRERVGLRIRTDEGEIRAGQILVATNGYSDTLIPGLARSLLPVNSFQVGTAKLPADIAARILPGGHAAYDSRRLILYFRKSPDDRVLIGGRASFSSKRDSAQRRIDYGVLEKVLHGLFLSTRGIPVTHRWTGLVCITPDFLPHYHRPEDGLHVIVGFNGRGVALSLRTGAWIARRMAGVEDTVEIPQTPIRPIPLHRFRAPVLDAAMRWNWLMDALGR